MSGENVYNLLTEAVTVSEKPTTGMYKKHMKEKPKPAYSTFYEKKKEYDGTHPRYFKQPDAYIGVNVGETVDPKNFLRAGKGVKHIIPPVHHQKQFTKAPLDHKPRKTFSDDRIHHSPLVSGTYSQNGGDNKLEAINTVGNGYGIGDGTMGALDCNRGSHEASAGGMNFQESSNDRSLGEQSSSYRNRSDVNFGNGANPIDGDGDGKGGFLLSGNADHSISGVGALEGKKDFITSNIIQVSNMVPKRRKDQPENLTCRKAFGHVPGYLDRVKQEIDQERMYFKAIEDARLKQEAQQMSNYIYRLDENERLNLIGRLKEKLREKCSEISKMPFAKDTFAQIKHRTELEKGIKEIEQSIVKLEKDAIFIYKDDPRCVHWAKDAALKEAHRFASQPAV